MYILCIEFPSESSMRLGFFSIYVSSIVILAIYSASLISFLALATPKLPFTTLEDYVKDGSYKLIVLKNSAEYYIPTVSSPLLKVQKLFLCNSNLSLAEILTEAIADKSNLVIVVKEILKALTLHDINK